MNWIPGVSQVKSVFQLVCGDVEGAAKTQLDFLQECPGVSQVTSTVQLIAGDPSGALETQKKCGKMLLRTADGVPVVGHAKSLVHYACGDTEGGDRAFKSATRTTSTMAAGAGGFLVGGPVGAVAGGIAGGAAFDSTFTVVDSIKNDEFRPSGYFAAVTNIVKNPNAGDIFDTIMMPVGDGLSGYSGGKLVSRFKSTTSNSTSADSGGKPPTPDAIAKANALEIQADAILEAAEAGKDGMPSGEYLRMSNEAKSLWDQAQKIKGEVSPPVDLKAPTASADLKAQTAVDVKVSTGTADLQTSTVNLPTPTNDDQQNEYSTKLIELWIVWETDTFPIIGINKWEAELVSAFVHLDIPKMKQICEEQRLEKIFDDLTTLTHRKVAQILLQTGAVKGETTEISLTELLKKYGKKGKEAVKQYFTFWSKEAANSKEKDKRAKRGEHIINNGVLSLHRDIMNKFLMRSGITNDGFGALAFPVDGEESRILKDCSHYFPSNVVSDIQEKLKVHFNQNELYIDANALIYGRFIEMLREESVEHMVELYFNPSNKGSHHTQPLRAAIDIINRWLLYVDQNALTKWRQLHGIRGEATYQRAKNEVWRMFDGLYDRLGWWIEEIRRRRPNN